MSKLVVGCGYLGYQAANLWFGRGQTTHCVTRSTKRAAEFEHEGFRPLVADITDPNSLDQIPEVDTVLFAVGFDRSKYKDIRTVYVDGLENVLRRLPKSVKHFIYISSTGVFGDRNGEWVDENSPTDPLRPGGQACLEAERLLRDSWLAERTTILRLAGIYGPNRIPRLAAIKNEQWQSLGPSGHINLIHVADAAQIVVEIAEQQIVNELFLVSDGNPPLRRTFYDFIAGKMNLGPIDWSVAVDPDVGRRASADKRISNKKLLDSVKLDFLFPDYQVGIADSISQSI